MANIILFNTNPSNTPIPPVGSTLMFFDLNSQPFLKDSLGVIQGFGSGGGGFYDNGNSSVNTSIDWSRGNLQKIAIDNNPTLSFTGATAGQKLTLLLKRAVGGTKKTITWADGVFWRDNQDFDLSVVNIVKLDSGFDMSTGFNSSVNSITVQPDGKILVGGQFTSFNGNTVNRLVKLNADGTLDGGFDMSTGFNNAVRPIILQPDGKILVGGLFTGFDGNTVNSLVRLNADGTLDGGFDMSTGFNNRVEAIALQPDGKILVGGWFTGFDGNAVNYLVRLNADGTLDGGFDMSTGFNGVVGAIALQPDGKILVGGNFTAFNGNTVNNLVRLNADGTWDSGFDMNPGFNNPVNSIALQPDGKILVGGSFTLFDGNTTNRLVRLNADGTWDSGFDMNPGFNNAVLAITMQPDGKILVGGGFSSFDGNGVIRLARLNADGTLDSDFDISSGFNNTVNSIALLPDGKILVGGGFNEFAGNTTNRLTKLIELTGDVYSPVDLYYTGDEYIGDY